MSHLPRLHPDDLQEIKKHIGEVINTAKDAKEAKVNDIKNKTAFTVKEVAVMLNRNHHVISRYCNKGIIKASKIGKSWSIPPESINQYFKSNA